MRKEKLGKKLGTTSIRGKKVVVRQSPKGGKHFLERGKKIHIVG